MALSGPHSYEAQVSGHFADIHGMGIMSDIDIMRQEGAREPEDFMDWGYNREDSEAMSDIVKRADPDSGSYTREERLEAAVRLVLAIELDPDNNIESVELAPISRKQLRMALR